MLPPTEDTHDRRTAMAVGTAALTGVGLRLLFLRSAAGSINSDEAVTGLMAGRLLRGEWRAFYWGQHYGGTLEVLAVAIVRSVGAPPEVALRLTPILLSALAAVLVARVGVELGLRRPLARLAGALFWVGPAALISLSTKAYTIYWASLCLSLLVVLLVLQLSTRPTTARSILVGLVSGLAWWSSPMSLYMVLPALLWVLVRHRELLRRLWLVLPAAVLGAAPWLLHNVGNGWPSLHEPPPPVQASYLTGITNLLWRSVPMWLGLRHIRTERWLVWPMPGIYLGLVVVTVVLVARRRVPKVVLLGLAVFPILYTLLPGRWWVGDGRYGLFLWPWLCLLAASLARRPQRLAALVLFTAVLAVPGMHGTGVPRPPVHLGADIRALEAAGIEHATADYWLAYRITFESDERVIVTPFRNVRYQPYVTSVRGDPARATLFLRGDPEAVAFRDAQAGRSTRPRAILTPHLVAFIEA